MAATILARVPTLGCTPGPCSGPLQQIIHVPSEALVPPRPGGSWCRGNCTPTLHLYTVLAQCCQLIMLTVHQVIDEASEEPLPVHLHTVHHLVLLVHGTGPHDAAKMRRKVNKCGALLDQLREGGYDTSTCSVAFDYVSWNDGVTHVTKVRLRGTACVRACVYVQALPCCSFSPCPAALCVCVCVQDVAEDLESVKLESIPAIRNIIHSNFADVFSCESRLLSARGMCVC